MHAADAVVDQPDVGWQGGLPGAPSRRDHLRPEPVVAEEDVADPGDQDPGGHQLLAQVLTAGRPGMWAGPTPGSLSSLSGISSAGCSSAGLTVAPRSVSAGSGAFISVVLDRAGGPADLGAVLGALLLIVDVGALAPALVRRERGCLRCPDRRRWTWDPCSSFLLLRFGLSAAVTGRQVGRRRVGRPGGRPSVGVLVGSVPAGRSAGPPAGLVGAGVPRAHRSAFVLRLLGQVLAWCVVIGWCLLVRVSSHLSGS